MGTKPALLFSGEAFENEADYKRLKNILIGEYMHFVSDDNITKGTV